MLIASTKTNACYLVDCAVNTEAHNTISTVLFVGDYEFLLPVTRLAKELSCAISNFFLSDNHLFIFSQKGLPVWQPALYGPTRPLGGDKAEKASMVASRGADASHDSLGGKDASLEVGEGSLADPTQGRSQKDIFLPSAGIQAALITFAGDSNYFFTDKFIRLCGNNLFTDKTWKPKLLEAGQWYLPLLKGDEISTHSIPTALDVDFQKMAWNSCAIAGQDLKVLLSISDGMLMKALVKALFSFGIDLLDHCAVAIKIDAQIGNYKAFLPASRKTIVAAILEQLTMQGASFDAKRMMTHNNNLQQYAFNLVNDACND